MGRQQSTPAKTPETNRAGGSSPRQPAPLERAPGHDIFALQQTIGNRAVTHLLGSVQLQPKLRVGPPGDVYEQEADRMADAIVQSGDPRNATFSEAAGIGGREEEDEKLLRQPIDGAGAPAGSGLARGDLPRGGAPLGQSVRAFFEPLFSRDFSRVRIHTGDRAAQAASTVRAHAFTLGSEIVFGAGEYRPDTTAGQRLLAHELTHVVQQAKPASSGGGTMQRLALDETAAPAPETTTDVKPAPSPDDAATAAAGTAPASTTGTPADPSQAPEAAPPGLVVEDAADDVAAGHMRKSDFLDALQASVSSTADQAMAGTGQTSEDCPWIDYWFGYYRGQAASHVEGAIRRFAPDAAGATAASDYIDIVSTRVRSSVESWSKTGQMPELPEGMGADVPRAEGRGIFFKARSGGPREARSPQAVRAQLGRGQPLEGALKSRMESAFNVSFSHVRMHTGRPAARLAGNLNARAFAVGEHVAFGSGEYHPGTPLGDGLIAHELAHVVQQSRAGNSTARPERGEYAGLETDADRAAAGVVASLWLGGSKGAGRSAGPRLSSGLGLQRCSNYPSYSDIIADAVVSGAANAAWASTLAATTAAGRREEGFWVQWNGTTKAYSVTPTVLGTVTGPATAAAVQLGTRPADTKGAGGTVYSVASFHTHTPTTFRTVGRPVGPSGADDSADKSDNVAGIVYDFIESPAGSGSIPAAHPLASPAQTYSTGNRRT